jgi:hypothetical protein
MKRSLKYFAALPLLALTFVTKSDAQIISRGDLFGPGAPPPFVGVFAGLGKHAQQGTFNATCGCTFENGDGNGLLAGAFFELPIDYEWAVGLALGFDAKHTASTVSQPDTAIVQDDQGNTDLAVLDINRTSSITTKYLMIAPYAQYQFFRMGPFIQAGPSIGVLIGSDYQQNRNLQQTDAVINGQQAHNLRFQNGTLTQPIDASQPIPDVSGLRLGLLVSAGYNIQVSERSVFSPLLTYDFPLTVISTTRATGWKIGSLYASAEIKFRLD